MDVRLLILSGILLVAFGCKPDRPVDLTEFNYRQEMSRNPSDSQQYGYSIKNTGNKKQAIRWTSKHGPWMEESELKKAVKSIEISLGLPVKDSLAVKTWEFVNTYTEHKYNQQPKLFSYSPVYNFNSSGGGLCSHRNALLCQLWQTLGYQARCVELQGHVVAEVWYKEAWHMYDADFGLFFMTDSAQVASVSELESCIRQCDMLQSDYANGIQNQMVRHYPYSYYQWFESRSDNRLNNWFTENTARADLWLDLPPGAEFRYPAQTGDMYDSHFAELIFTRQFTGMLHLPFLMENYSEMALISPAGLQSGLFFASGEGRILMTVNPLLLTDASEPNLNLRKSLNDPLEVSFFTHNSKPDFNQSPNIFKNDSLLKNWLPENPAFADTAHIHDLQSFQAFYRSIGDRIYPGKERMLQAEERIMQVDSLLTSYQMDKSAFYQTLNQPFPLAIMAAVLFNCNPDEIQLLIGEYGE
jgi:hypothetical protein